MVIFLLAIALIVIVSYWLVELIDRHNVDNSNWHPAVTEIKKTKAHFAQLKCAYCGTILRTKVLLKGRCVSCGASFTK